MNNQTKTCKTCNQTKSLNEFISSTKTKDKKAYKCKECFRIELKEDRKTISGMIKVIHSNQVLRSKRRNHEKPQYTRIELEKWITSQPNFYNLYSNWVNSNFITDLKPSVDRIDNSKGYSFDNIRLITWFENNHKEFENKKNGINNDFSKTILQYDMSMNLIKEHYSIRSAARELNVLHSGIMRCCKLKQKYAYDFIWRYKNIN